VRLTAGSETGGAPEVVIGTSTAAAVTTSSDSLPTETP
jgi:hypothetical protein